MPTEVRATGRAEQQIARLHKRQAKTLNQFLDDLTARGCQALAYRLSGPTPIDHLCVMHLSGALRVVVAFESPERAWVLLVGAHDDKDPIASAVAMLAARLAAVPMVSAAQGSQPDLRPARRSASRTREATISTPSTDRGNAWACQPASPCAAASIRM